MISVEQSFRTSTSKWSLELGVHQISSHAKSKILLPIPGRMLLTILSQLEVYPAVVSTIDTSTALVDLAVMETLKMYVYTIQKTIHGVESMFTQIQVVK